jgi:hypothetical protein
MGSNIGRYRQQAQPDLMPAGCKIAPNPDGRGYHLEPSAGRFFPWECGYQTRDSGMPVGEHVKQKRALSPDALRMIVNEMNSVAARITRLEAQRRQPQPLPMPMPQPAPTRDASPRCACGRAPTCICENGALAAVPYPVMSIPTKGDAMYRAINPNLAPLRGVTFDKPKSMRDQTFGERLRSRFDSREQDRLSRYMPSGSTGMPTQKEINDANTAYHAGHGASGQPPAWSAGGQPGDTNTRGQNIRGGMLEALSNDLAQGFANALQKIPNGEPQAALNAYHAAFHKARTPAARDAVDKIWSAFQRR